MRQAHQAEMERVVKQKTEEKEAADAAHTEQVDAMTREHDRVVTELRRRVDVLKTDLEHTQSELLHVQAAAATATNAAAAAREQAQARDAVIEAATKDKNRLTAELRYVVPCAGACHVDLQCFPGGCLFGMLLVCSCS